MTSSRQPTPPGNTSLLDQFQNTRASFMGLVHAHIDLLKAELNDILGEIKTLAGLAGAMLLIGLMTAIMLWVGGFLFLGEWLFGSIGWGFAHGILLGIGLLVTLALTIAGSRARYAAISFVVALLLVVGVALLCGLNVAYDAANSTSTNLAGPINTPGFVALIGGIVIGAILFALLLALTAGTRGLVGGLFLGAVLGALAGWLIAGAPWTWPPAIAFAILIGLVAWPILHAILAYPHLDVAARFERLQPKQSIEAMNETREWLEEQWQTRLPARGKK
jgi:hypothetical protein